MGLVFDKMLTDYMNNLFIRFLYSRTVILRGGSELLYTTFSYFKLSVYWIKLFIKVFNF